MNWRKQLSVGDVLLVCDVGGGTTDLTLVEVSDEDGNLVLQRKAVGNHLLVGGDNMDLALALLRLGHCSRNRGPSSTPGNPFLSGTPAGKRKKSCWRRKDRNRIPSPCWDAAAN